MAILRCSAGTFYDVPDQDLAQYREGAASTLPESHLAAETVDGTSYRLPPELADSCRLSDDQVRDKLSARRRQAVNFPTEEALAQVADGELPVPRAYCGVWVNVWFNNWNNFWRNYWRNCWRNGYPPPF